MINENTFIQENLLRIMKIFYKQCNKMQLILLNLKKIEWELLHMDHMCVRLEQYTDWKALMLGF